MNRGSILSIDDDEGFRGMLTQYFEAEGYAVITAKNGSEASELVQTSNIDIILVNLALPDMDAVSLIRVIRQSTSAHIFVVTEKNDVTEKIICLEVGADDYLTKPLELRVLKSRIKAAIRRVREIKMDQPTTTGVENETETLTFGKFTLDRDQYQVFDGNGKSIEITIGEFQLLEALVKAPKRTLSREQLFERTRDGEYDIYDRAIDIQIGRIRKKLGEDGSKLIKTMRGVGYMYTPLD